MTFPGIKTYLVAAAMLVYELLGYFLGKHPDLDMKTVFEALGLAALRAGIAKGK